MWSVTMQDPGLPTKSPLVTASVACFWGMAAFLYRNYINLWTSRWICHWWQCPNLGWGMSLNQENRVHTSNKCIIWVHRLFLTCSWKVSKWSKAVALNLQLGVCTFTGKSRIVTNWKRLMFFIFSYRTINLYVWLFSASLYKVKPGNTHKKSV